MPVYANGERVSAQPRLCRGLSAGKGRRPRARGPAPDAVLLMRVKNTLMSSKPSAEPRPARAPEGANRAV